jgi:hypothetical protein
MRKLLRFLVGAGLTFAISALVCYTAHAALSTAIDAQVVTTNEGATTVYWPFTGSASGTDNVRIPYQLHGMLDAAFFVNSTTAVIANTATVLVKEVISYAGTDTLINTDISGGNIKALPGAMPKAVHLWPTYTYPISSEIQLELSGALTAGGAPASGTFILTLIPNAAKGN